MFLSWEHRPESGQYQRAIRACQSVIGYVSIPFLLSSKQTEMKTSPEPTEFPPPEIGPEMNGADVVVQSLIREGVDVIFAYPGGASQELHQALARTDKIPRNGLLRHDAADREALLPRDGCC